MSFMRSLFGKPSTIDAQRQQARFDAQQREAQADKDKARDRLAQDAADKSRGRASTILTGGTGLLDDDTAKHYLL